MGGEELSQPTQSPIASTKALQMVLSVKLPILKKGEYILWTMKMEQYMAYTDYALWEQILARTRERKAKSTLFMAIPDEHLARFHGIKYAKTLWAAIKTRFGEGLDKGYDRFQRLLNLLEIHRAGHSSQAQGSSSYADELMFSFFANQSSTPHLDKDDLEQIDQDDLEEIDLKWQVAMLSMRVKGRDNGKRPAKEEDEQALVVQDGLGTYDWSYRVEKEATDFALMVFTSNPSRSSSSNSKEKETETVFDNRSSDKENSVANDRFMKSEGYHAVHPPLTGNYMPPKHDMSFAGLDDSIYKFKISDTITSLAKDETYAPKTSTACVEKPKEDRSSAHLIED
nr:hypothetical protein [Tanacetum cinerariifolium]